MKKNNPKHYWELYSEAEEVFIDFGLQFETRHLPEDDNEPSSSLQAAGNLADSPSNLRSTWGSTPTRTTRTAARSAVQGPSSGITSPPAVTRNMKIATPSRLTPVKKQTPVKQQQLQALFATLEEAIEMCDHHIMVDPEFPEGNGHGIVCMHIPGSLVVTTSKGDKFVSDVLKITIDSLVDLRDYKHTKGQIVLNGKAFLITKPAVSSYLLMNHKELFAVEANPCARTEQEHAKWATAVTRDEARRLTTILCIFPDGMTVTNDMQSIEPTAPNTDRVIAYSLREVHAETEVEGQQLPQSFVPGFFFLRVVEESGLIEAAAEEVHSLARAFQGMLVK